jgi:hypothetical protein
MAFGRCQTDGLDFFLSQQQITKEINLTCQDVTYTLNRSQGI